MLARRFTTILPAMTLVEALETTRPPRVAGLTGTRPAVVTARPCRAPPQTLSAVGLIAGRRVKNVTWLAWQSACSPELMHLHAEDIFYK